MVRKPNRKISNYEPNYDNLAQNCASLISPLIYAQEWTILYTFIVFFRVNKITLTCFTYKKNNIIAARQYGELTTPRHRKDGDERNQCVLISGLARPSNGLWTKQSQLVKDYTQRTLPLYTSTHKVHFASMGRCNYLRRHSKLKG